ncbi:MAG: efflux RND transporter periplasmic adaptor subunit [Polyangiaceae bacterium]|nr:efflux RND transporter periplasmic adaptor subunit [Polyangiaceae bacterium]
MGVSLSEDLASLKIDRSPPPRTGGGGGVARALVTLGALAGLVAAGVVAWPRVEARLFKLEVSTTEISTVSPLRASVELTATGYVVAERVAKVGAGVEGRVVRVHVREGQRVQEGDKLVELDVADARRAVDTLRSRARAASARAAVARATLAELSAQLERDSALAEKGAIARAPVEDLARRVKTAEESARASEADARAASVDARNQSGTLRHGLIVAPMAGTVVGRPAEVGDVLSPLSPTSNAAVELVDMSSLVVEADVPEARLSLVKPGGPAEIVLEAFPDARHRGEVVAITPRVSRSKATVVVKARLLDAPKLMLPDMSVRVSFLQRPLSAEEQKAPPKIVVPSAALAQRGGRKVVFTVDGGKVREVPVELGPPLGDGFELRVGPASGTRLVKSPPDTLIDGKSVRERSDG